MTKIICSFTPRNSDEGKTPWFPATAKPERAGWYEKRYWGGQLRYFDGEHWRRGGEHGEIVFPPEWRGMLGPNAEITGG